MGRTLGIFSVKGGVGKTTIVTSLAADLANHHNKKVLLVDANHTTPHVGMHMNVGMPNKTLQDILLGRSNILSAIHKRYAVDVIPGDMIYPRKTNPFKLKNAINRLKEDYDFVFLDSAPSLGDEMKAALLAADGAFIVTTPDEPTLHASLAAAKMMKDHKIEVHGLILNKMRDKNFEFNLDDLQTATGIPVVACLPDDIDVGRALFTQIPMPLYRRSAEFSRELSKLSAVLIGKKQKIGFFSKVFGFNKKPQEVNREILRNDFYTSIFSD